MQYPNSAYAQKIWRGSAKPIVCKFCLKSVGTLVKVGDKYAHKECMKWQQHQI